jgi:hypothetical protein
MLMSEPVAWMFQGAFDISTYVSFEKPNSDIYPNPTPLYTHPAKILTDEEIAEIIQHLENAKYVGASKAADMLRQQQSEIEALKSECKRLSEWLVKVGEKK